MIEGRRAREDKETLGGGAKERNRLIGRVSLFVIGVQCGDIESGCGERSQLNYSVT